MAKVEFEDPIASLTGILIRSDPYYFGGMCSCVFILFRRKLFGGSGQVRCLPDV